MTDSLLEPTSTTVNDLCSQALYESGVLGVGQVANAIQLRDTQVRLQWMLQQWERKRWMVYHLVTINATSTGAQTYTFGPGGQFDTGPSSVRPSKIESAYVRQLNTNPNAVDFPLEIMQSMEDYNRIALKGLSSFPGAIFLDPGWPLGTLYVWPVPNASIYGVFVSIRAQLPSAFATSTAKFDLPFEYYAAMLYNLAMRCRARWQIGTYPGDPLPELAKEGMKVVRGANVAIARLQTPDMNRSFEYNIFSDRHY